MRFISSTPKLIGKANYGVWQVTAEYSNGEIKRKNYIANTIAEAKVMYLREHGGRISGQLSAEFIRKICKKY
jgi:hypothetical protein